MPANPLFYSAHDARPRAITGTFTSAIFVAFKVDMRRYYPNQLSGRNFPSPKLHLGLPNGQTKSAQFVHGTHITHDFTYLPVIFAQTQLLCHQLLEPALLNKSGNYLVTR